MKNPDEKVNIGAVDEKTKAVFRGEGKELLTFTQ